MPICSTSDDDATLARAVVGGALREVGSDDQDKTYRSKALAAIHETASDLHDAGVMDKRTLREFDDLCLTSVRPMRAADIRALRTREGVSQAVFARYLNVTTGLVSQWERGEKHPAGASLKLLNLVDRHGLAAIA